MIHTAKPFVANPSQKSKLAQLPWPIVDSHFSKSKSIDKLIKYICSNGKFCTCCGDSRKSSGASCYGINVDWMIRSLVVSHFSVHIHIHSIIIKQNFCYANYGMAAYFWQTSCLSEYSSSFSILAYVC